MGGDVRIGAGRQASSFSGGARHSVETLHGWRNTIASVQQTAEGIQSRPTMLAQAGVRQDRYGDCTKQQMQVLQGAVKKACDAERRCTREDVRENAREADCAGVLQRIQRNLQCRDARKAVNDICYNGGDEGHRQQVTETENALKRCETIYQEKCAPLTAPAPLPEKEQKPAPHDDGFMRRMEEITGLTGAALIAYLLLSESSRVFPPRNLVPAP